MTCLTFFEKPGCITNGKQKTILKNAGIAFESQSLIAHPWQPEELFEFFKDEPVATWFNPSAPDIKSGKINPNVLDQQQALELMLANPILIRRPLIKIGEQTFSGFDWEKITALLNVQTDLTVKDDIEQCSHPAKTNAAKVYAS